MGYEVAFLISVLYSTQSFLFGYE